MRLLRLHGQSGGDGSFAREWRRHAPTLRMTTEEIRRVAAMAGRNHRVVAEVRPARECGTAVTRLVTQMAVGSSGRPQVVFDGRCGTTSESRIDKFLRAREQ